MADSDLAKFWKLGRRGTAGWTAYVGTGTYRLLIRGSRFYLCEQPSGATRAARRGRILFLTRGDFLASLAALNGSSDVHERAIGANFSIEENVGDPRRDDFQNFSASADLRDAADAYFRASVQGIARGHLPSTFMPSLNDIALLPSTVEPNQKVIRVERIDQLISADPDLSFDRLSQALRDRDRDTLVAFTNLFAAFPGERPAFAAFRGPRSRMTFGNLIGSGVLLTGWVFTTIFQLQMVLRIRSH